MSLSLWYIVVFEFLSKWSICKPGSAEALQVVVSWYDDWRFTISVKTEDSWECKEAIVCSTCSCIRRIRYIKERHRSHWEHDYQLATPKKPNVFMWFIGLNSWDHLKWNQPSIHQVLHQAVDMLIVAFFLKSTGAGFWWALTASWHGSVTVTFHSWGWCPGFVKPRGPPNWIQFALRRSLAWSLMEKGVTVGSSLSGNKRGKCFLPASVVLRFEWHSSDGDFSLFHQIHGWFPGQGNSICMLHGYFAPRRGRQPMIDPNPRFKRFFCSSWSSKRGRDWKCRPNQSIPKLYKDFGDRKQLLPSIRRASIIRHSRVQTLSLEWERFESRSFV